MTASHFAILCEMAGVHPSVAMENQAVVNAVLDRVDDDTMSNILNTQF